MKKKIATIALAIIGLVAVPAIAQNPQTTESTGTEQIQIKQEKKAFKGKKDRKGKRGDYRQGCKKQCCGNDTCCEKNPLGLSAEQETRVNQLRTERKAKLKEIKSETRTEREAVNKAYDEQLQQVLTPEQYGQYQQMRQKKDRMVKPGKGQFKARNGKDKRFRSQTEAGQRALVPVDSVAK